MATPAPRRSSTTRRTTKTAATELAPGAPIAPLATADDSAQRMAQSTAAQPAYDDIARAAYHRYLNRGGGHGDDLTDWIEAERELKNK